MPDNVKDESVPLAVGNSLLPLSRIWDKMRSDLGSVRNQLTATISTTMVNVYSSESTIRDVDFAEEA